MNSTPLVSIALVVRNEELRLKPCLEHLLTQDLFKDLPSERIEFLIVDNKSADQTVGVAMEILRNAKMAFQVLFSEENNMGLARAIAARHARGEFLAFVDADCWAPENWLRRLLREFELAEEHQWPLAAVASGNVPCREHGWGQVLYSLTKTFLGHFDSN